MVETSADLAWAASSQNKRHEQSENVVAISILFPFPRTIDLFLWSFIIFSTRGNSPNFVFHCYAQIAGV